MGLQYFEEQIFFSTLRIHAVDPLSGKNSIGTGFLLWHPAPGSQDQGVVLLVTCRHVLFDERSQINLTFHQTHATDNTLPALTQSLPVRLTSCQDFYFAHPDPEVDVAVLNVSQVLNNPLNLFLRWVTPNDFASFTEPYLVPGCDVLFVGYPEGRFDQINNLPILRAGKIASLPKVDYDGKPEFLIDAQVYRGSSGSPVFARMGPGYRLVGMVGRSHTRYTPLQVVDAALQPGVELFLGLGVVYKPKAVLEVAERAASHWADSTAAQETTPTASTTSPRT